MTGYFLLTELGTNTPLREVQVGHRLIFVEPHCGQFHPTTIIRMIPDKLTTSLLIAAFVIEDSFFFGCRNQIILGKIEFLL